MKIFDAQRIRNTLQRDFEIKIERCKNGKRVDYGWDFQNGNDWFFLSFSRCNIYVEYGSPVVSEMYGPEQVKTTKEILALLVEHFVIGGPKEIVNRYIAKQRDRLIDEILKD